MLRAAILSLVCSLAFAQAPAPKLTFESATVRPTTSAPGNWSMQGGPGSQEPDHIAYQNVTLRMVLVNAYQVQDNQISAPAWMNTARYDIAATLPLGSTVDQSRTMLQNLLADKFGLKLHHQQRDFTLWTLTVADDGPKLMPAAPIAPEPAADPTAQPGANNPAQPGADGFPTVPPHQSAQNVVNGIAKMAGRAITVDQIAGFLRFPIGTLDAGPGATPLATTQVLNRTGLVGEYDVKLQYAFPAQRPADAKAAGAPDLFTALQQQLGLKLEKNTVSQDVLVIDHANQKPAEN